LAPHTRSGFRKGIRTEARKQAAKKE